MDTDHIGSILEEVAPGALAESWDNVGWQLRLPARRVSGVLLTLDVTRGVLEEASRLGSDLIVAHHPPLFRPISSLDLGTPLGALLGDAIQRGISIWAAHTNLDVLPWGTSFALAEVLGLGAPEVLARVERGEAARGTLPPATRVAPLGFGAVGSLPVPASTADTARDAATRLSSAVCVVAGDPDRLHQRVAVVGGSGGSFLGEVVRSGSTLFITADVRYHEAQDAVARGLDLVSLDHFSTERPVLEGVRERLEPRLRGIPVWIASTPSTPYVSVRA